MRRFVVGADGGNTKSHYALFDTEGRMVRFVARGPVCHQTIPGGFGAVERELALAAEELLGPAGLTPGDVAGAVFGLAGADTPDHHRVLGAQLEGLGFSRFRVVNDAFLGIKAGTTAGWGVCSINGTGTVTAAVGSDGSSVQVGGLGFFTGDEGGGGYLAERVLRAVYDARYRRGPATALTGRLLAEGNHPDVESLFLAHVDRKIPILRACQAAFAAAAAGDGPARSILEDIGRNAVESALGALGCVAVPPEGPVDFVLAGSLYVKGETPILAEVFEQGVRAALGGRARVRTLREPPVTGAVLWALEDLGAPVAPGVRRRVLESFNPGHNETTREH